MSPNKSVNEYWSQWKSHENSTRGAVGDRNSEDSIWINQTKYYSENPILVYRRIGYFFEIIKIL